MRAVLFLSATRGYVCPSVSPSLKIFRSAPAKERTVPLRSLYRPATYSRFNGQSSSQGYENAEICFFSGETRPHMVRYTLSTDHSVPIPGVGLLCLALLLFLFGNFDNVFIARQHTDARY